MSEGHTATWERRRSERRAGRPVPQPARSADTGETVLRASEERFHALAHLLPDVIWTASTDGTLTFLNDRWYEYSGIQVRGTPGATVHPDERERILALWMEGVRGD